MGIIVFILLAGLWAAFLLPSFFDHRRKTPKATTRDYAKSRALLATASAAQPYGAEYARRRSQVRRKRVLLGLGFAAVVSLAIAPWLGSIVLLSVSLAFDLVVAGYVTLLLSLRSRPATRASVVPIRSMEAYAAMAVVPEPEETSSSVRVIAG